MVKKAMRVWSLLLCSILLSNSLVVAEGSFIELLRSGDRRGILELLAYSKMSDVLDRVEALRVSEELVTVDDLVYNRELSEEFGAAVDALYSSATVEDSVAAARRVRELLDAEMANKASWSENKRNVLDRLDYVLKVVESGLLTAPGILRSIKYAAQNLLGWSRDHKMISIPLAIATVMLAYRGVQGYKLAQDRKYNKARDPGAQGSAFWLDIPRGFDIKAQAPPEKDEHYTSHFAARRGTQHRNEFAARVAEDHNITGDGVNQMRVLFAGLKRGGEHERERAIAAGTALESDLGRKEEEARRIATARVDALIYVPGAHEDEDGSDGETEDRDDSGSGGPKAGWLRDAPSLDAMQMHDKYVDVRGVRTNTARAAAARIFADGHGLDEAQTVQFYTFVKQGKLDEAVVLACKMDPSLDPVAVRGSLAVKLERGRDVAAMPRGSKMVYLDDSGGEGESGGIADPVVFLKAVPRHDNEELAALSDAKKDAGRDAWACRIAKDYKQKPGLVQDLVRFMRKGPRKYDKTFGLLTAPRRRIGGGFGMEAEAARDWLDRNLGTRAEEQAEDSGGEEDGADHA